MIHVFSPFWRHQKGILSFWITNTTTNNTNSTNDTNNTNTREKKGPTTEAGRRKKAEAEAAKREKEERRREKNRKKREAYRTRQREKAWTGGSKRAKWTKSGGSGKEHNGPRPKDKSRRDKKETAEDTKQNWKKPKNQEEWEATMSKALKNVNYEWMEKLFELSFKWTIARGDGTTRRLVTKQFRLLSIRFHPDKHPDSSECYKVAFQALNTAHGEVMNCLLG